MNGFQMNVAVKFVNSKFLIYIPRTLSSFFNFRILSLNTYNKSPC